MDALLLRCRPPVVLLAAALALFSAGGARAADKVTDTQVVGFLMELEETLRSRDVEQLVAFVEQRYTDDIVIALTVNLTMLGQNEPVVQQARLSKAEQIEQFRQAAPLYAMTSDHAFDISVKDVLIEAGGSRGRALYEAKESAIFDAKTADGTPVKIRHRTDARCSALIVPASPAPKLAELDCVYKTVADQP